MFSPQTTTSPATTSSSNKDISSEFIALNENQHCDAGGDENDGDKDEEIEKKQEEENEEDCGDGEQDWECEVSDDDDNNVNVTAGTDLAWHHKLDSQNEPTNNHEIVRQPQLPKGMFQTT